MIEAKKQTVMTVQKRFLIYLASIFMLAGAFLFAPPAMADGCSELEGKTSVIKCNSSGGDGGPIFNIIKMAIQIMTAGVGILAVGAVAYGGVLYASAANNAEQIKKAKAIFLNVSIGLAMYAFLVVLSNFLIPGGVF